MAAKLLLLLVALLPLAARGLSVDAPRARIGNDAEHSELGKHKKPKHKRPYTSPVNLFIQERASKQLPGPGQHFSFGALTSWDEIHSKYVTGGRKLLLVIRHGQAVSNYLGDTLGPDEWFKYEQTCSYTDSDTNKTWGIFDADLTDLGAEQAKALNLQLGPAGWFKTLTSNKTAMGVVSPLSRCLETATHVLEGLQLQSIKVEEYVRETLGEDTCDARRSVSDPESESGAESKVDKKKKKKKPKPPCDFEQGLKTKFPKFQFQVLGEDKTKLGLISDEDTLWYRDDREHQKHQVKRAKKFLDALFEEVAEDVVVVVTHSGFTRSLLLAVGREPYRPVNAELVPVIVEKVDDDGGDDDDDGKKGHGKKKHHGKKDKKDKKDQKDKNKHGKKHKKGKPGKKPHGEGEAGAEVSRKVAT